MTPFEKAAYDIGAKGSEPIENERLAFEVWCKSVGHSTSPDYVDERRYWYAETSAAWDAWQGSRNALAADLAQAVELVTDEENERFSQDVSNFNGADPEATKYALDEFLKNRTAPPPAAPSTSPADKPHYKLTTCQDCMGAGESRRWGYDDYSNGWCHDCSGTGKVPTISLRATHNLKGCV